MILAFEKYSWQQITDSLIILYHVLALALLLVNPVVPRTLVEKSRKSGCYIASLSYHNYLYRLLLYLVVKRCPTPDRALLGFSDNDVFSSEQGFYQLGETVNVSCADGESQTNRRVDSETITCQ